MTALAGSLFFVNDRNQQTVSLYISCRRTERSFVTVASRNIWHKLTGPMLPDDVKDAELEVIRAASRTTIYDARSVAPLEKAVQDMTRLLRNHGLPPERALVYVKGAAFKARLSFVEYPAESVEYTNALLGRMLYWFLEAYFEEEKEPALR
jgi:hypothetical protein